MKNTLNTISHWYGRLGNNIQQICNGILYSEIHEQGFFIPPHELIDQVVFNSEGKTAVRPNRFFYYNTEYKDFDIPVDYLYKNIRKVAKKFVSPKLKVNVGEPFDDDTLVIHIRSGDVFSHPPPNYIPNPLCYYLNLIEEYDKIVVVTETDNYNPVVDELKKIKKVTIQTKTIEEDFATLMRAKNLASSGAGTFAVAAALCSSNIENFYCSNIYLDEHLNPDMLIQSEGINVYMMELKNYIEPGTWSNSEQQRKFILEYKNENI